jgi:hypothetical protein
MPIGEQQRYIKSLLDNLPSVNKAMLSVLLPFFARIVSNSIINKVRVMHPDHLTQTDGR